MTERKPLVRAIYKLLDLLSTEHLREVYILLLRMIPPSRTVAQRTRDTQ